MLRLALVAAFAAAVSSARAADPLDSVPPAAQAVLVIDNPRKLAEAVTGLGAFHDAQKLAPVQQFYESAPARRALQLLAFAEKQLGAKWPDLLDQLAGNGAVLAFQYDTDAPPALLILAGTDEKQSAKALDLAVQVITDELSRQGVKDGVKRGEVLGHESFAIGNEFHFARVGATVLVSNKVESLKAGIEAGRINERKSREHPIRRVALGALPKNPLAWLWVDLAAVKKTKAAKDFFDATRQDFLQTLVVGATIDTVRRSDFLAVGVYQEKAGFRLALRLPAGREGMWTDLALHVPPKGTPGTLPLLDPPGTIYSHSLYLDIGYMWKHRDTLINEEMRRNIQEGEKQISRVLPSNVKLGDLLEMWGPHHRVVVVNHDRRPYKTEPSLKLPAFGYVGTGRDKKFASSLDPVLRSAALIGALQYGLKMTEQEHEGVTIVSYRFPENKVLADDPDGLRFNFEPCFAVVGDELVLASTLELGKKLVTELKKPQSGKSSSAVLRGKLSARGGAEAIAELADPLVTNTVLGRGVSLAEARKEVAELIAFVKALGTVTVELDITDTLYKIDVVWEIPANGRR